MTKILVTGGAGFIGSHLADALAEKGHEVVVVDNLSTGKKENLNSKVKFLKLDIADKKLAKVFSKEKPEAVFHMAAQSDIGFSIANPVQDAEKNILGLINILELSKNNNVKKIIFASSAAVYGPTEVTPTPENLDLAPLFPYGIGKAAGEMYLDYYYRNFNLPYVALRFANVYGPRQRFDGEGGVVAIFCNKAVNGDTLTINGDGRQTRDFIYVDDVVTANIAALENDKVGIFNVSSVKETSVNQLAEVIKKQAGSSSEIVYNEKGLAGQARSALDNAKAKAEFSWQPVGELEQGIAKTIEWVKNKK